MSAWKTFELPLWARIAATTLAVVIAVASIVEVTGYLDAPCDQHSASANPEPEQPGISFSATKQGTTFHYHPQTEEECDEPDWWGLPGEPWLALLTLALVIGTVALAAFTYRLWTETRDAGKKQMRAAVLNLQVARKQVAQSRRHAELELRAHVMLELAQAVFVKQGTLYPVHVDVKIKNFGRTPAYKVRLVWETKVYDWPVNSALTAEGAGASIDMIAPGSERLQRADEIMRIDEFDAIDGGSDKKPAEKALFLYGRIDYIDAFEQPRWTTFQIFMGGMMPLQFRREFLRNGTQQDLYFFNSHGYGNDAN